MLAVQVNQNGADFLLQTSVPVAQAVMAQPTTQPQAYPVAEAVAAQPVQPVMAQAVPVVGERCMFMDFPWCRPVSTLQARRRDGKACLRSPLHTAHSRGSWFIASHG